MISETELAYWAGMMDGDGHIGLSIHKKGGGAYLGVSITGQYRTVQAASSIWPGRVYCSARKGEAIKWSTKDYRHNTNVFYISWHNLEARSILEDLLPYLKLKQDIAKIALEFLDGYSDSLVTHPIRNGPGCKLPRELTDHWRYLSGLIYKERYPEEDIPSDFLTRIGRRPIARQNEKVFKEIRAWLNQNPNKSFLDYQESVGAS